jgi:ATP-dependent DNA ligase
LRRDGVTVRLFTRRGYDWTDRYRAIANAAAKLKAEIIERRRRNFRSRRGWP